MRARIIAVMAAVGIALAVLVPGAAAAGTHHTRAPATSGSGTDYGTIGDGCLQPYDWYANTGDGFTQFGIFQAEWDNTVCNLDMETRVHCQTPVFTSYWNYSGIVEGANIWDSAVCTNIFDTADRGEIRFRTDDTGAWTAWQTKWST